MGGRRRRGWPARGRTHGPYGPHAHAHTPHTARTCTHRTPPACAHTAHPARTCTHRTPPACAHLLVAVVVLHVEEGGLDLAILVDALRKVAHDAPDHHARAKRACDPLAVARHTKRIGHVGRGRRCERGASCASRGTARGPRAQQVALRTMPPRVDERARGRAVCARTRGRSGPPRASLRPLRPCAGRRADRRPILWSDPADGAESDARSGGSRATWDTGVCRPTRPGGTHLGGLSDASFKLGPQAALLDLLRIVQVRSRRERQQIRRLDRHPLGRAAEADGIQAGVAIGVPRDARWPRREAKDTRPHLRPPAHSATPVRGRLLTRALRGRYFWGDQRGAARARPAGTRAARADSRGRRA